LKPQLYLVSVYEIKQTEKEITVFEQDMNKVKSGGMWNQTKIKFPEIYEFTNYSELIEKFEGAFSYKAVNGTESTGVDAGVLPEICDVYIQADKSGIDKVRNASEIAYKLIKGFAKVGIIALVDEATGYQYERERDELQKILKAYVSEELIPWQQRFPDEYYREIFRLNGWDFTVRGIKKRPGVIGHWTNNLVYKQLPKGVLEGLRKNTPKSISGNYTARLHQSLTLEIGEPHLEKQLVSVITLMRISDNWDDFLFNFNKAYGQRQLFDTRTFESPEVKNKEPELSDFNKKLIRAIEYDDKGKTK
jgi:hypothetical protein